MFRSILFMLLLLSASTASAALHRYVADEHESRWVSSSSKLYCSLIHEIPIFGKVKFERYAAGQLGMTMEAKRSPHKVGMARIISVAPSWKHGARERDLGQVNYTVSHTPITLQHIASRRLLLELEEGMFPTFTYQDWADGRDEVQVSLSAVNIHAALGEFLDCVAAQRAYEGQLAGMNTRNGVVGQATKAGRGGTLAANAGRQSDASGATPFVADFPYNFSALKESKIYFDFDSSLLDEEAQQRLEALADYLLADESVSGVVLYGRTDSKGTRTYNDALGHRRAVTVRNFLLDKGIDASRFSIRVRSLGERRPVASNRTLAGRAMNRMVEVELRK